jgi:hypothetical protein
MHLYCHLLVFYIQLLSLLFCTTLTLFCLIKLRFYNLQLIFLEFFTLLLIFNSLLLILFPYYKITILFLYLLFLILIHLNLTSNLLEFCLIGLNAHLQNLFLFLQLLVSYCIFLYFSNLALSI